MRIVAIPTIAPLSRGSGTPCYGRRDILIERLKWRNRHSGTSRKNRVEMLREVAFPVRLSLSKPRMHGISVFHGIEPIIETFADPDREAVAVAEWLADSTRVPNLCTVRTAAAGHNRAGVAAGPSLCRQSGVRKLIGVRVSNIPVISVTRDMAEKNADWRGYSELAAVVMTQ